MKRLDTIIKQEKERIFNVVNSIATEHLDTSLNRTNSGEDFKEQSVWGLEKALSEAFKAGLNQEKLVIPKFEDLSDSDKKRVEDHPYICNETDLDSNIPIKDIKVIKYVNHFVNKDL